MTQKHQHTPPVDPTTLPDPEDITEADVGQAPPRPEGKKKRRFGGTHRQIRSAQKLYKITAWLTGLFLLLLVVQMIVKYGFGQELFAGGTTEDGTEFVVGLYHEQAVVDGVNISLLILIVHGWLYVLYLLGCFRLWAMMRWGGVRLLAMAGGGVVPFLSFIVEKQVNRQVEEELAAHPEGVLRY
jgi:integral membrane protein